MNKKTFINLTNGIEKIPQLNGEFSFIRIQSSQCESKKWLKVITGLDDNFLMYLSLGYVCEVIDYSQKKDCSRALFQGLSLIEYILNRRWYDLEKNCIIKDNIDVTDYYKNIYNDLFIYNQNPEKDYLKNKLKYYKKFCSSNSVKIIPVCYTTTNDGNNDFYVSIIKNFLKNKKEEYGRINNC